MSRDNRTLPVRVFAVCLALAMAVLASFFSVQALADEQPSPDATLTAQNDQSGTFTGGTWSISGGVLTISGTNAQLGSYAYQDAPWFGSRDSITSVVVTGSVSTGAKAALFSECTKLTSVDLSGLIISSNTTDLSRMFVDCMSLTSITWPSNGSSSAVTNTSEMFMNCSSLANLDISHLNTKSATSMDQMFYGCSSLGTVKVGTGFSFKGNGSSALCMLPTNCTSGRSGNWVASAGASGTYSASSLANALNGVSATYTAESVNGGTVVYRVLNPSTGEHLYSADANEVRTLVGSNGWTFEGSAWIAPASGTPVYRLFQPSYGLHHYTADAYEIGVITSQQGWRLDFSGAAAFKSGGEIKIYRLFNRNTGQHLLTTDAYEYGVLPTKGWGWEQEPAETMHCAAYGNLSYAYPSI